jgi:hypothetical protein
MDLFKVLMALYVSLVFFKMPLSIMILPYSATDSFLLEKIGRLTKLAGGRVTSSSRHKMMFRGPGASRAQKDPEPP